jgi:predicted RNase H-like HicB family nuclease
MKKKLQYYLSLDYPIQVERMDDGTYCASIPLLKGCKGYAATPAEAIEELNGVKEALIELMIEEDKQIPEPSVKLEIPVSRFARMKNRKALKRFVKA